MGNEHLRLRFYVWYPSGCAWRHELIHKQVDGPLNKGTVHLHMIQPPGASEYDYQTLAIDIPGRQRPP